MQPQDSPFARRGKLKQLPFEFDGTFSWLKAVPLCKEWAIGTARADSLGTQLKSLKVAVKKAGLKLPSEFLKFIRLPSLHNRVRSTTACYLDISESLFPFKNGFLVRFLNDQQGCCFWYVYLNADGSDHCVVASEVYCDVEVEYTPKDLSTKNFHFWAVSFEAAVCRFWLENEIDFSKLNGTPLPNIDQKYL